MNRNHFGFHIMLGICALIGLLMAHVEEKDSSQRKSYQEKWLWARKNILIIVGLFFLYSAEMISLSRGGFISMNLAILILGCSWVLPGRGRRLNMHRAGIAMTTIFLVALMFSLPFVLERLSSRFEILLQEDGISSDARVEVWKSTFRLIGDYWGTGVGMGAYGDVIQIYARASLNEARIEHAHNDYLEWFAEIGIPMGVILLGMFGYGLFRSLRRLSGIHEHTRRYYIWAGNAALTGCALHEFFDYNLLAYPNALIVAAYLGMIHGLCEEPHEAEQQHHISHLVLNGALVVVLVALVPFGVYLCHSVGRHKLWLSQQKEYHPRGQSAVQPSKRLELAQSVYRGNPRNPRVIQGYVSELIYSGNGESDGLQRQEIWNHALVLQNELLCCRPAMFEAWQTRGILRYALEDIPGALADFERAMSLAPTLLQPKSFAVQYYEHAGVKCRDASYALRAEQIQRSILAGHPEMAASCLPKLLTKNTSYRKLVEEMHPTQELGLDILEILLTQHRFMEAEDCLKNIPEWELSDSQAEVETRLQVAAHSLTLANVLGRPTEGKLAEYLSVLKEHKIWEEEGNLEAKTGRYMTLLQQFEDCPAGPLPRHRLQVAQHLKGSGRMDALVEVLMPLVYPNQPYPPTAEERNQALEMLGTYKPDILEAKGFQFEALRALLAGEHERVQELKELYQKNSEMAAQQPGIAFNKLAWLNVHLLDMGGIPQEEPPSDVLAFMQSYAQVISFETKPTAFKDAYETLEVTVTLRVQNGIKKPIEPMVRLTTSDGVFATIKLKGADSQGSLLWKTGDILTFHAEIPNVLTLAAIRVTPTDQVSSVVLEVMQDANTPVSPRCLRLVKVYSP